MSGSTLFRGSLRGSVQVPRLSEAVLRGMWNISIVSAPLRAEPDQRLKLVEPCPVLRLEELSWFYCMTIVYRVLPVSGLADTKAAHVSWLLLLLAPPPPPTVPVRWRLMNSEPVHASPNCIGFENSSQCYRMFPQSTWPPGNQFRLVCEGGDTSRSVGPRRSEMVKVT